MWKGATAEEADAPPGAEPVSDTDEEEEAAEEGRGRLPPVGV